MQGHLLLPGIFDGEHIFELQEIDANTTRFIHAENFKAILIPFQKNMLDVKTRNGFHAMNVKLKELCENIVTTLINVAHHFKFNIVANQRHIEAPNRIYENESPNNSRSVTWKN